MAMKSHGFAIAFILVVHAGATGAQPGACQALETRDANVLAFR